MENASKALIMAAEVLIGVMIISIGVYIFNVFAGYSEERYKRIEDTQIAEFNTRFLKFYGTKIDSSGADVPVECTIHDITSLANLAQKHNIQYDIQNNAGAEANTLYVQIDLESRHNIEKYTNSELVELIKQNDLITSTNAAGNVTKETKYFKCTQSNINETTGRVNDMKFQPAN